MLSKTLRLYKNAYSGLPRNIWLLSFITLVNRSGTMVLPFMSVYLTRELNFSLTQAGLILSLFGVGSVIGALIGGKLTDKIGYLPVQFWSLTLGGLLFMLLLFMETFETVAACVLVLSIISEAFRPANSAAVALYSTPETRTRAYALNRLAVNLGFSIGPTLGGLMAFYSYDFLFIADGLTCIASAIMLRLMLPPIPKIAPENTPIIAENKAVRLPYSDGLYMVFVGLVCLFAISFFQFFATAPLHYKLNCHLNEFEIGMLMSLNGFIIVLVEMVIVYRLQSYRSPLLLISFGMALMAVSYVLMAADGVYFPFVLGFVVLITFSEIFSMPFMNTFVVERSTEENRGQYMALYSVAYSLAHVLAPTLGTQIVSKWGFEVLWQIFVLNSMLAAVGFMMLHRYRGRRNEHNIKQMPQV